MSAAKLAAPCVFVELGLAGAVLVMGWSGVEGVRVLPLPCSPNCALGCPPPDGSSGAAVWTWVTPGSGEQVCPAHPVTSSRTL